MKIIFRYEKSNTCIAINAIGMYCSAKAGNKVTNVGADSIGSLAARPKMIDTFFISWTGTINTSWATPGNWSNGLVPTENDDILIPFGTPFSPIILNATIGQCNSMKIMAGAVMNVATGGILTIKSGTSAPGTPNLITTEASLITNTSAQLGGSIISIGDCAITQHGIALSTYNNPTINQTIYPDVSINGLGAFSISTITCGCKSYFSLSLLKASFNITR